MDNSKRAITVRIEAKLVAIAQISNFLLNYESEINWNIFSFLFKKCIQYYLTNSKKKHAFFNFWFNDHIFFVQSFFIVIVIRTII